MVTGGKAAPRSRRWAGGDRVSLVDGCLPKPASCCAERRGSGEAEGRQQAGTVSASARCRRGGGWTGACWTGACWTAPVGRRPLDEPVGQALLDRRWLDRRLLDDRLGSGGPGKASCRWYTGETWTTSCLSIWPFPRYNATLVPSGSKSGRPRFAAAGPFAQPASGRKNAAACHRHRRTGSNRASNPTVLMPSRCHASEPADAAAGPGRNGTPRWAGARAVTTW